MKKADGRELPKESRRLKEMYEEEEKNKFEI